MSELKHYVSAFESLEARRAAGRSSAFGRVRRAAIDRFVELGFPTVRLEEWRFTNVAPIADQAFAPPPNGGADVRAAEALRRHGVLGERGGRHQLVFVNGHYAPELSHSHRLPGGVTVGSLATVMEASPAVLEGHLTRWARYEDHAFVALNTALFEDGACIYLPDNTVVEEPLWVFFISTPGRAVHVTSPRSLIVAGANSQATIVETYVGSGTEVYLTNAVTEIVAGANAILEHYKVQSESKAAFHVATLAARQDRHSKLVAHSVALGGALVRNDVGTILDGQGAECVLNGLYMVGDRQHVDNHTTIDHAQPHSGSLETYKGVLDGASRAVFSGRITVRQDAQKVVARQTNKNLLLSEDAAVNSKPQLQIHADDVKCFHGATVGMLEEDALFYLRSRGMSREVARELLVYAFVSDILGQIRVQPLRDRLESMVLTRVPTGREVSGATPS